VQNGGKSYTASNITAASTVEVTFQVIPVITSATTASGTYETVFGGYTVVASGSPTSFSETGLPTGLTLNTFTGLISGTPTQPGTFSVHLTATNNITGSGTATLTLTVSKAPLTVAVNSGGHSTYGSTPLDPGITLTSGTLYNGDTLASIGLGDSFSSLSLNSASSAGTFTIDVTGAANVANYTVTTQSATYTINQAPQTITFPTIVGQEYPGPKVALGATATSGLTVSYSIVSGPATVSGSTLTLTGIGTVKVQAIQTGNTNYLAATSVTQSFTVTAAPLTLAQWEAQYFNSTQMGNAAISGATATPEGDGVPNLLKYVYNIDPAQPMTATERALLPVVVITATTETLTYYQYSFLTGVTVEVQTSPDLQNWTTVSATQIGTDGSDAIMQAKVTITPPRQFIRVHVTMP